MNHPFLINPTLCLGPQVGCHQLSCRRITKHLLGLGRKNRKKEFIDKMRVLIEQQLKRAVLESDMSRYRIAKISGLSEAQLSYFVNDKRSLTLPTAAKLAKALGLKLVKD
jgi:hypothetical protein